MNFIQRIGEETRVIPLGDMNINFFSAIPQYEDWERKMVIVICQKIWRMVMEKSGNPDFRGFVRFDLVPSFAGEILDIAGIYEINTHQPECMIASAKINNFRIVEIVAEEIRSVFGNQSIAIVMGKNPLKNAWGGDFLRMLKIRGRLNISVVSEDEAMKMKSGILWRIGDARLNGAESHFSPKFVKWLSVQEEVEVFNSFCGESDPGRKDFLLRSDDPEIARILGDNRLLTKDSVLWALQNRNNLVLKPNEGGSGNGVYFGRDYDGEEWHRILENCLRQQKKAGNEKPQYALWEKNFLSKIEICGQEIAMDLNPTFWANGLKLKYLYTVYRADSWERYFRTGVINVARGAGLFPIVV